MTDSASFGYLSQPLSLHRTVALGFTRVWLVRYATYGLPRIWRSKPRAIALSVAVKSFTPLAIALLLQLLGPPVGFVSTAPYFYIAGFCLVCTLSILLAWHSWTVVFKASAQVDELTRSSRSATEHSCAWLLQQLSRPRQTLVTVAGVIAGNSFLAVVSHNISSVLEIRAASYVTVTLLSATAFHGLYMLKTGLQFYKRVLLSPGPKAVIWHAPARTPILKSIAIASWRVAAYVAGITIITEILAALVPARQRSTGLEGLLFGFPILGAACCFGLLTTGYLVVSAVIRRGKADALTEISERIGTLQQTLQSDNLAGVKSLMDIHADIQSSPSYPYSFAIYVPILTAVIGPLVAFLLSRQG